MLYVCALSEEMWIYPGSGVRRSKRLISKLRDKWLAYFGEDKMRLQQNKSFWDSKGCSGVVVYGFWGMGEQKASVPVKEHLLFLSLEERRSCHKEQIVTNTYSKLDFRSNLILKQNFLRTFLPFSFFPISLFLPSFLNSQNFLDHRAYGKKLSLSLSHIYTYTYILCFYTFII